MEIFELRYFLGVAQVENVNKASKRLHISPGSLSKAIARLESELSVNLFSREGRNIRLTDHGRLFQRRAAEIVRLEEAVRLEIAGHQGEIRAVIAGPEILLSEMGVNISNQLKKSYPKILFEYEAVSEDEAIRKVSSGDVHLALVSAEPASRLELTAKVMTEPEFQTVVGKGHPLYSAAKANKVLPIERVLEHVFVSPNHPLLGKVGIMQSLDGWRDDKFPRKVGFLTSSLKLLEELVIQGHALAYLPDYYAKKIEIEVLRISGCPYTCVQKIRILAKDPHNRGWLNRLF